MNIRIVAMEEPDTTTPFDVQDQAVAELFKHGWEPPAGNAYCVNYRADGKIQSLFIPARPMQRSAQPTAEQLETIIINRIQSRISLGGGLQGNFVYAYQQGIKDAAEAIHDLISDPS